MSWGELGKVNWARGTGKVNWPLGIGNWTWALYKLFVCARKSTPSTQSEGRSAHSRPTRYQQYLVGLGTLVLYNVRVGSRFIQLGLKILS